MHGRVITITQNASTTKVRETLVEVANLRQLLVAGSGHSRTLEAAAWQAGHEDAAVREQALEAAGWSSDKQ